MTVNMGDANDEFDHNLQLAAFQHQPTPIIVLSHTAIVVFANNACQQLFHNRRTLVGTHVKDIPIVWQDGTQDALLELLTQNLTTNGDRRDEDQNATHEATTLKLQIETRETSGISARLLVSGFTLSGESYRMLSFENVREIHTIHTHYREFKPEPPPAITSLRNSDKQQSKYSTPAGSTNTTSVHLNTRFSQFRDAVYFNSEDRAGFLLSADESFCFPSYRAGARDVAPVEIDDIELFFQDWDVWDAEFTQKQSLDDYPSIWLNRNRTKFEKRRYGLKDGGKEMVVEASGDPLYDIQTGEYIGGVVWLKTLGEYADVAAEDLKATLADFRTICDRLPHLLWTVDSEGQADYFSRSWYDFTGLSEAESLGLEFQKAINPNDMMQIWASFARATESSSECYAEARYRRHDGEWIWMSVRAKPVVDKNGRILKWYGSSTDIHNLVVERMEAERKKVQTMDMLSLAQIGLFEVSSTWHLNMLQGRMVWLEERKVSELLTKLEDAQDGGVPMLSRRLQEVMAGKNDSAVFEEQIQSRWYKFRLVYDTAKGSTSQEQRRVIGCSVDITEQRERAYLESENARLTTEASLEMEKSRLKTAFLAHMSHEIRTPIAGIIGMADMLNESQINNEQKDCVGDIQISANNLLTIVNDILDLSKIEAGKLTFEKTKFDLDALILQVKKHFVHIVRGKDLQIKYTRRMPEKLEVVGDSGRINQIITNLVSNAVKFTSKGSIEISACIDGPKFRICVEDTGEGIDDQTLTMLFKPFVQGDASTARRHGGTGLGLTISRNLAESMGGTLTLESVLSSGTKACLTLPAGTLTPMAPTDTVKDPFNGIIKTPQSSNPPMIPIPLPTSDTSVSNVKTSIPASIPDVTSISPFQKPPSHLVLIVEDNAINQKIALTLVRKLGYPTLALWNGLEALNYISDPTKTLPSLILMDCQMPLMDGYQATRHLRTKDEYIRGRNLPIVALTASAISGDREKCSESGMDDYLSKPVSKFALAGMLKKWLD